MNNFNNISLMKLPLECDSNENVHFWNVIFFLFIFIFILMRKSNWSIKNRYSLKWYAFERYNILNEHFMCYSFWLLQYYIWFQSKQKWQWIISHISLFFFALPKYIPTITANIPVKYLNLINFIPKCRI